ncbi:MAG: DUF21 domain-containing protein [Chthoniobacterales bacterium]|nr:DUF21 domain-containing protein [Chthoniobacterales bacterium]
MMLVLGVLLLLPAFVFAGLDAAWQALDPVRLRHRADKGDRRAKQMLAWAAVRPQADLVLAWTGRACAAASLVLLAMAQGERTDGAVWWTVPLVFMPVYAVAEVVARQVFRRLPFVVLSRLWWLVAPAASFWAPLARPAARLLRRIQADPLPRPPAAEELRELAGKTEGISPLELAMLGSVLDFRRLTAGLLALPVEKFAHAPADATLGGLLAVRELADAEHTLVIGADGVPLGAMTCGAAALSGAMSAHAQSFARPLLSFPDHMPAWTVLIKLRRARTAVAEVRDEDSGRFLGVITEQTVVARLLGQPV